MTNAGEIYDRLDAIQLTHDELLIVLGHFARTQPNEMNDVLDIIVKAR